MLMAFAAYHCPIRCSAQNQINFTSAGLISFGAPLAKRRGHAARSS
jgi:hypothetical protein